MYLQSRSHRPARRSDAAIPANVPDTVRAVAILRLSLLSRCLKASSRWDKRFNRGLHRVRDDLGKARTACYGVYLGQRAALWDDVRVLPLVDFLKRLWAGEIIGAARLFS